MSLNKYSLYKKIFKCKKLRLLVKLNLGKENWKHKRMRTLKKKKNSRKTRHSKVNLLTLNNGLLPSDWTWEVSQGSRSKIASEFISLAFCAQRQEKRKNRLNACVCAFISFLKVSYGAAGTTKNRQICVMKQFWLLVAQRQRHQHSQCYWASLTDIFAIWILVQLISTGSEALDIKQRWKAT